MAGDDPTRRAGPDDSPTACGLAPGTRVFGRYTLDSEVGRGGMGVVWRARDVELDESVALKFLPEVVACDDAAVAELKEETRHARRLTHPNIVRIHQFEREGVMAAVSMNLSMVRRFPTCDCRSRARFSPLRNSLRWWRNYARHWIMPTARQRSSTGISNPPTSSSLGMAW